MNYIFILILLTGEIFKLNGRQITKNTACRRLPYDFYNVPGTNDYFFLRYDILNPKDARQYCLSQGMDLPSITTKQQNEIIYSLIRKNFVRQEVFHTAGIIISNSSYAWLNGDPFKYKNFQNSYNYNPITIHISISRVDGKWVSVPCDSIGGVICHVRC